jgi:RNA polymerase sigma factor (sigma-70 family)
MTGDRELLDRYIHDASQAAFGELAARHLDLVYASARRQLRNEALAEDVTQAVFIMLAKKAATWRANVILPAWLLTATWYACKNAMRREHRRRIHESGAALIRHEMSEAAATAHATPSDREELGHLLDKALHSLREIDRAAVVMHFLEGQTFEQVAQALKTTPEAARKRTERAIEKLRTRFGGRGLELATPAAVTPLLLSATSIKAPPALLAKVASTATTTGAGGAVVASIAAEALRAMAMAQLKAAAVVALVIAMIVGGGAMATVAATRARTGQATIAAATAAATAPTTGPSTRALDPSNPRDVMIQLAHAVVSGDGQLAKSFALASDPADQAFLDEAAESIRILAEFRTRFRERFGDKAATWIGMVYRPTAVPDDAPVVMAGDHATVTLERWQVPLVRVGNTWKIPSAFITIQNQFQGTTYHVGPLYSGGEVPPTAELKVELARLNNRAYSETMRGIVERRFKTPEQALADLNARLSGAVATARRHAKSATATTTTPSSRRSIP